MRKTLSFLLALVMMFSLCIPAFAANVNASLDKNHVQAGDEVTVTLTLDAPIANIGGLEYHVYYDANKFDYVRGTEGTCIQGLTISEGLLSDSKGTYRNVTYVDLTSKGVTANAGVLATFTFKARETATADTAAFEVTSLIVGPIDTLIEDGTVPNSQISISISPAAPVVGYAVAMSQDVSVTYGENVQVAISVANDAITTYNAYDVVVVYDSAILNYQAPATISGDEVAVTHNETEHTIRITGYGSDKAFSTALATLNFTAKAVGGGTVTIQSAKVSNSSQAIGQDAPEATITDADIRINVTGYPVTLTEDFTGPGTANPGEDYTFIATDKNYNYTFTATVGGEPATVVDNGDGTFTIKNVNGEVIITATKTPKTFTVTVTGDGAADVTADQTATYLTDYTFTVTKDAAYAYTVKAQIGNGAAFDVTLQDGTYKIPGADITGDITITVTKTLAQTKVVFSGTGSGDVVNGTEQTAEPNKDFTFSITKAQHYSYTVKLGETELTADDNGTYTIPAASMNTAVVNVTVEKTADFAVTVEVKEYVKLDGQSIFLVTATGTLGGEDKALAYGDSTMYWSEKYSAYAWLVISRESADTVKSAAEEAIQVATATATNVDYSCDVNGSTNVDINDAQLVYDMYNTKYTSFEAVTMLKFLNADVNGDGKLDVNDSAAIVNKILNP